MEFYVFVAFALAQQALISYTDARASPFNLVKCVDENVFVALKGVGMCDCALECLFRTRCTAFSYFKHVHNCNLIDTPFPDFSVNEHSSMACIVSNITSWDFTDRNTICRYNISVSIEPCYHRSCSNTFRCTPSNDSVLNYTCQQSECLKPPLIVNAEIRSDLSYIGRKNSYSCIAGYTPFGDPGTVCLADGMWSQPNFSCYRNCPIMPIIENAIFVSVNSGRFTFNSTAFYACLSGYYNVSVPTAYCDDAGNWIYDFNCYKYCNVDAIPIVANGVAIGTPPYTIFSSVTYSCLEEHYMVGRADINCTKQGTWTQPELHCWPYCLASDIPNIPFSNPNVPSEPFTFLSVINYHCNSGYYMHGQSDKINCTTEGTWTSPAFECYRFCLETEIPIIPYSIPNPYSPPFWISTTIGYTCNSGFYQSGPVTTTSCTRDGVWIEPDFTCTPFCDTPPTVAHTVKSLPSQPYLYMSETTYTCTAPYFSIGSTIITCQFTGEWTAIAFLCYLCNDPPNEPNSEYTPALQAYKEGDSVSYTCNVPYFPIGYTVISCQSSGEWTTTSFQCYLCNDPAEVPNSDYTHSTLNAYKEGDTVSYTCKAPYFPIGSTLITCQPSGQWTAIAFQCYLCNDPPDELYSYFTPSANHAYEKGDIVPYMCQTGTYNNGDVDIKVKCLSSGNWSSPAAGCNR